MELEEARQQLLTSYLREVRAQVGLQSGPVRMEPQSGPVRSVVPLVRSGPVRGPLESGPVRSAALALESGPVRSAALARLGAWRGKFHPTILSQAVHPGGK